MKKLCAVLVLLVLLVAAVAFAEGDVALNLTQVHDYEVADSLCYVGDTLYMLGTYGVYAYQDGELSTAVDLSDTYLYRYNQERPEDETEASIWEKAISVIFTDGQTLYGLQPYSGQIFQLTEGKLEPYTQLPEDILYVQSDDFYREIKGTTMNNGKLFLLLGTDNYNEYDKTELAIFDFATQDVMYSGITGIQSIAQGEDCDLIIYTQDDENAIWKYNANSDMNESEVMKLEGMEAPSGMAFYQGKLVYFADNRVYEVDEAGNRLVKAYIPVQYAMVSTSAACSEAGVYAYPYANHVFLRDISKDGESTQTVLTLMGSVSPDMLVNFSIEHPDVAVVSAQTLNSSEIQQAALSGDDSIDLFVVSAPGSYTALKEKGYLAAIDNELLCADAKTLYPAIQNVIFDGETLLGYPISLMLDSWTVNETQWKNMELGEYPTTYAELFDKIKVWLDEYALDYPDYTLADIQQMGIDGLVTMMVKAYVAQNENEDGQISFDTEEFHSLMALVAQNQQLFAEENEQWGMPLISSYYMGFGITYADRDAMVMLIPPTLEKGQQQTLNANIEVICISASSKKQEAAKAFVAYCAEHLAQMTQYEIHPNMTAPVESTTYKARLETLNSELNDLQDRYAKEENDEKKYTLEDEITAKQEMIASVEDGKWAISPESIEIYRKTAEQMTIPYQSKFSSNGSDGFGMLSDVILQYCADGLEESEVNALIHELNRVADMVYMENH